MGSVEHDLNSLATHWLIDLPDAFARLYLAFEYPYLSPCEFFSLEDLLHDVHRWRGVLPQFLPFGDAGGDLFGFYVLPGGPYSDYPVLRWNHEYDHYAPVASGFHSFLRWCVVTGRYEANDIYAHDDPQFAEEEEHRREFAEILRIPLNLLVQPLPANERELNEHQRMADPQSPSALDQLGCFYLARGELDRARDCFARASETAPWFADPYFLIAETYRLEKRLDEAALRWWQVVHTPIALSTRTGCYDLGVDDQDREIADATLEYLRCHRGQALAVVQRSLLTHFILDANDPFTTAKRVQLAAKLREAGDLLGCERELLNALTLATVDAESDLAYDRLQEIYQQLGRTRDAEMCARDRDL